jgi:aldehyde dehydrogenase (NAD+)
MSGPASDLSCNALFIGGEWRKPEDGSIGVVISPSTEEVIATAAQAGEGDIAAAVTAARDRYFLDWAVPFGGMKASGLGREFGPSGFLALCETQSVQRAL